MGLFPGQTGEEEKRGGAEGSVARDTQHWSSLLPQNINTHTHTCTTYPWDRLALTQTLTEEMISQMVLEIKGSYKIQYHADGPDKPPIEIDFQPPWWVMAP